MNSDRRIKRTSREIKPDMESLGERIAPAVYSHGLMSLNLIVEQYDANEKRELKIERLEELKIKRFEELKIKRFEELKIERREKLGKTDRNLANRTTGSSNATSFPMSKPSTTTTAINLGSGTLVASNPANPPMVQSTIATTSLTGNSGTTGSSSPAQSPLGQPTIVTTTLTGSSGTTGSSSPVLLPIARSAVGSTGLPSNVANALVTIYGEYEQDPAAFKGSDSTANGANLVLESGDQVGIQIHDSNATEFQNLLAELTKAGMKITDSSAAYGVATGMLPIAELAAVGQLSPTTSINPEMAPLAR